MPTYDYKCEASGQVVEVKHRMSETVETWGQLCELAGISPGETPLTAPVKRLPTGGNIVKSGGGESVPPCQIGGGCPGGGCGSF
ncbi:MAG: zinc ribbon domain-containing protein [Gammaproteobacteria bacterium]|nr:zinc ribbon domain-containing protein [Gammaproteobacteria bacterium]